MKLLTSKSFLAIDTENEIEINSLIEEQNKIVVQRFGGLDLYQDVLVVKFDSSEKIYLMTVDESIQSLALKNGADLVEFDNGDIGFIGYYNNVTFDKNNCVEFLRKATATDCEIYG